MTHNETQAIIGKIADYQIESVLSIKVTILDCKNAYGNTRYLVRPVAGNGERWADSSKITLGSA